MEIVNNIKLTDPTAQSDLAQSKADKKLKKACKDFESYMVNQMLTKMRESVQKTDLFGSSKNEEIFQGMIDQRISESVSGTGNMQLADMLYKQLSETVKKP